MGARFLHSGTEARPSGDTEGGVSERTSWALQTDARLMSVFPMLSQLPFIFKGGIGGYWDTTSSISCSFLLRSTRT